MDANDLLKHLIDAGIATQWRVDDGHVRVVVHVHLQDGETSPFEYVIDPSGGRMRAALDYDGWVDAAPTPAGIRAAIAQQQAWRQRTWPNHPAWWAADLTV